MAIRRARVESVAGDELDLDAFVSAPERSVEDKLVSEERVRRSAEALRALKPDEAKALMMKAHGLSYAEIGERNGWSYTNVMATVAVFIALGGSSYAALQIDSGDIANNSVRGVDVRNRTLSDRDVKRNGLTGRSIRESRLGRVPRAREADRLGGMTAADLALKCPEGTFVIADVCVETTPRSAVPYGSAVLACATTEPTRSPGRRLPTYGELRGGAQRRPASSGRRAHRRGLSLVHEARRRGRARRQLLRLAAWR